MNVDNVLSVLSEILSDKYGVSVTVKETDD